MILDRRNFLKTAATAGAAAAFAGTAAFDLLAETKAPGSFDFAFFTDTHIEPELDAAHGCDVCFKKIVTAKPDFAIMGGDHVYDATSVGADRAKTVFDLYEKTSQSLQMPVHHVIGNHDPFGSSKRAVCPRAIPGTERKCTKIASAKRTTP